MCGLCKLERPDSPPAQATFLANGTRNCTDCVKKLIDRWTVASGTLHIRRLEQPEEA